MNARAKRNFNGSERLRVKATIGPARPCLTERHSCSMLQDGLEGAKKDLSSLGGKLGFS